MPLLETIVVVTTLLDILDAVFDFGMVHQLAHDDATKGRAAWLGICTTIALALELVVKSKLRQKQDEESAAGFGTFDINESRGRTNYIFSVGIIELTIFNVEDATALRIFAGENLPR